VGCTAVRRCRATREGTRRRRQSHCRRRSCSRACRSRWMSRNATSFRLRRRRQQTANCRCDEGVQLRSAQLVSVQRVNKTGNRDVLLANTRRVLASPNVVFLHASEEKHDCRQCVKPYDANERDASGDGLKWVDCENDGCSAWFCPTCAPDEEAVPSHLHLSSSSIAMPPPLDRRCRRRKRSSFCITNDSYSIDNNSPPSNDDNSQPATTIRNQR
jgi:hypothetical protein